MTHQSHLIFLTPSLVGGGIETSTQIILELLEKSIDAKTVWIGVNKSRMQGDLPNTITFSGERISKDGIAPTLKTVYEIRNRILRLKNPIIVINGEIPELIGAALPKTIKMICVEHASKPWMMNRQLGYVVRGILRTRVKEWVTVNLLQEEIWPGIKKFSTIPNPVSLIPVNEGDPQIRLFTLGRIVESKGIEGVCWSAWKSGMSLDVYGTGELEGKLKEQYSQISNIRFMGYQNNVWQEIGPNQVLISASRHEGDGRIIAEAIVRRQPVLLIDTPDHRRFELPSINYFKDFTELQKRLDNLNDMAVMKLRPPQELVKIQSILRNPEAVTSKWRSIIQQVIDL